MSEKLSRHMIQAWVWIQTGYVFVFFGTWLGPYIFDGLSTENAFARSGALMVLVSIFAEIKLKAATGQDKPAGFKPDVKDIPSNPVSHQFKANLIAITTHATTVIGTLIWAYGDLIWTALL